MNFSVVLSRKNVTRAKLTDYSPALGLNNKSTVAQRKLTLMLASGTVVIQTKANLAEIYC